MKIPIDRAEEFAARPVPHSREWLEAIRASGERGWQLYRKMGSPKNILAPMVDQSETVSTSFKEKVCTQEKQYIDLVTGLYCLRTCSFSGIQDAV